MFKRGDEKAGMSDHIKVNTNNLKTGVNTIHSLMQTIEKELNDMEASVKELSGMWEGTAKDTFMKAYNDDIKALRKGIDSLKSVYEFEKNAENKYQSCERQVQELVNSIRI